MTDRREIYDRSARLALVSHARLKMIYKKIILSITIDFISFAICMRFKSLSNAPRRRRAAAIDQPRKRCWLLYLMRVRAFLSKLLALLRVMCYLCAVVLSP